LEEQSTKYLVFWKSEKIKLFVKKTIEKFGGAKAQ
jgi:hypothetical protein